MKPGEADRLIRTGNLVTLRNPRFNETFGPVALVSRDRWNVYASDGGCYDRGELVIVKEEVKK